MAVAAVLSPVLPGNESIQIAAEAPHVSNESHGAASMAGAELLVARMSSVLQSLGYDENVINKVGISRSDTLMLMCLLAHSSQNV
jgi:hypothetical protein